MSTTSDLTPQEIATALAARRELGPDYEDAIAASLAERMAREISHRVDAELRAQAPAGRPPEPAASPASGSGGSSTAIAVISLLAGVPITITALVATSSDQLASVAVCWAGIVAVNVAHTFARRRR